jgi:hypothetical protein
MAPTTGRKMTSIWLTWRACTTTVDDVAWAVEAARTAAGVWRLTRAAVAVGEHDITLHNNSRIVRPTWAHFRGPLES